MLLNHEAVNLDFDVVADRNRHNAKSMICINTPVRGDQTLIID